ncbi:MAG TPA: hypothetical protein VNQ77_12165 [Frankiaceae bacterium]|nr:hypothetical protein [Frankiaceae bacterium]
MSAYDDERVITLLRDTVPEVPDVPHRLDMIKHRAGRQRARLWVQAVGAVTGVLLVVGVAAAVGRRDDGPVEPVSRPIDRVADALADAESLRWKLSLTAAEEITAEETASLGSFIPWFTGAATKDGDASMVSAPGNNPEDKIVVDGVVYSRSHAVGLPPGEWWIRGERESAPPDVADAIRWLRIAEAFAEEVRYVGQTTVRGVRAAEYHVTTSVIQDFGTRLEVTFAMDAKDRPLRVASTFVFADLAQRIGMGFTEDDRKHSGFDATLELLLYDYGDDVGIEAPPEDRTMTSLESYEYQRRWYEEQEGTVDPAP